MKRHYNMVGSECVLFRNYELMSVPKVVSPRTYSSFVIVIFDIFSRFFFQIVDVKDAVSNSGRKKI